MYSLSHIWPVCFPSGWCLCSFDMSPLFLVWFLTFWQYKVFQDFLVPSPRQPFLQGASFFFFFFLNWRMVLETKIWVLGGPFGTRVSLLLDLLMIELVIYVSLYTEHTFTHTNTYTLTVHIKIVLGLIIYVLLENKHTNERIIFMSCSFGV